MQQRRLFRARRFRLALFCAALNRSERVSASYRCLEDFQSCLVADRDAIPGLTEHGPFGSKALSDELGMIFRFLPGFALMSQGVMGWKLARQVKEKPLHNAQSAALKCPFLRSGPFAGGMARGCGAASSQQRRGPPYGNRGSGRRRPVLQVKFTFEIDRHRQ
jgi:hypothetical protein